jgi:DNA-directed RNA polymerase subunit RPC12/RpoP
MINNSEVYLFSDQPTTCPKCGNRTEITWDLFETPKKPQHYICLSPKCGFEFVMQEDIKKDKEF